MPARTGQRGPTLDLKSLEVFLTIMESGSITRAAQSLGMPKSQAKSWSRLPLADLAASVPMVRYSIRSGLGSQPLPCPARFPARACS
ncbi:MAG: LysR family transcriptional regulator [Rhodospirillales bacterium]|nr:LysR family transcriptional regulator [Rhodospirillales bacterium]